MYIKDYEDFKIVILEMTGINLSAYKERQMKRRVESLIKKNNIEDFNSYVKALNVDKNIYNEFINYLTINVSEFYRNPAQWEVLEEEVIPMVLKNTSGKLKIWSSACSTGEEPYSLTMMLTKFFPLADIRIIATDIDEGAISKAQIGLYNPKGMEGLPKTFLAKFFTQQGNYYKINDEIKNCVTFSKLNLLSDQFPKDCDLILCRNVLIYFTEEAKVGIYENFHKALKTDGILFVGSTEQIIMPNRYNLKPVRTFFYQNNVSTTI